MRRTEGRDTVERDYLSIREVLDLLVAEFPEITISKIRFLESRGLIHPERTPSGYRKFYEGDVERLRWILRQQREHFLPLKVIKGRLEGTEVEQDTTLAPSLFDQGFEAPDQEPAPLVGVTATSAGQEQAAIARAPVAEARQAPPLPSRDLVASPSQKKVLPASSPATEAWPADPRDTAAKTTESVEVNPRAQVASERAAIARTVDPNERHESASSAPAAQAPTNQGPTHQTPTSQAHELQALNGASLSAEELANASGASRELLAELETYGLIASRDLAGEICFDGDAVAIARAAAGFAAFGIEPRHLRSFKHAVERDASLLSQVVVPLLRQRNPEARARARRDLEALTSLSTALRQTLLEIELRPLTGG